jgi:hypothetical protein
VRLRIGFFLCSFFNRFFLPWFPPRSKVTRAGKVIHIRIKHAVGTPFQIEGTDQTFPTLIALVNTSQVSERTRIVFNFVFLKLFFLLVFAFGSDESCVRFKVLPDFYSADSQPTCVGISGLRPIPDEHGNWRRRLRNAGWVCDHPAFVKKKKKKKKKSH